MKKIIFFLSIMIVTAFSLCAAPVADEDLEKYEETKLQTTTIIPENQHCTDKNASVKIEYNPMYDEVRIYYETLYVTYDKGEAMNTVMACLLDFQKDNQYYSYNYLKRDSERYFRDERGQRKAQYSAYLKFNR